MTAVLPFYFGSLPLRVVDRDGAPWFMLNDVCAALEIANPRDAASRLDDDERDVVTTDTPGGMQPSTVISESGVYSLTFRSRKASAQRFKRWVTHDVLPSIRRTGQWGTGRPDQLLSDPQAMRALLLGYVDKLIVAEAAARPLEEKAAALDRLASTAGAMCVTDAAKALGLQPKQLFGWLIGNDWIYRRNGSGALIAYQNRLDAGVLRHKVTRLTRTDGTTKITEQVLVTGKGLARLAAQVPGARDVSAD